jgi:hypothetical protein
VWPTHLQYNITVTAGGNYAWEVVNGFLLQKAHGPVEIDCGNDLTRDEAREQAESGTDWEKDLWPMVP